MNTITTFLTCPTQLNEEHLAHYWRDGYIAFEGALSPKEVEEARSDITEMVTRLATSSEEVEYVPSQKAGTNYSGARFKSKRSGFTMHLEPGFVPDVKKPEEIEHMVRKFSNFQDESRLFHELYTTHPRVQGVCQSILGKELDLYQAMALIKPAFHGSEKPWHQDNAYFSVEDLDGILGTWIALDDVTIENGAMHFLPGGHRMGPLKHMHTSDCEIEHDRYSDETAEPICLKAGGIILFHGNAPHFTPPNKSAHRRRAIQYHYRSVKNKKISKGEYDQVFKEKDGTPASCAAAVPENF
jgi:phytanoyl-CoA hydroxylase